MGIGMRAVSRMNDEDPSVAVSRGFSRARAREITKSLDNYGASPPPRTRPPPPPSVPRRPSPVRPSVRPARAR